MVASIAPFFVRTRLGLCSRGFVVIVAPQNPAMRNELRGKVAVITGAAGGIGKALADEMSARGCRVVLVDVQAELLARVVAELGDQGAAVEARPVDVRDAQAMVALIQRVHREHGRLDYVFNNAGINICAELADTTLDDWNQLIDVNLRGVVHGVHAAYPIMRKQGFGHIVNTASAAGLVPAAAEGAYAATKHAVVGLSEALRIEARAYGVRVSVICPGLVDTPILRTTKYVNLDASAIIDASPQKPIDPRRAAKRILRGVERDEFYIVFTATLHALWRLHRFAPNVSLRLGNVAIGRFRRSRIDRGTG